MHAEMPCINTSTTSERSLYFNARCVMIHELSFHHDNTNVSHHYNNLVVIHNTNHSSEHGRILILTWLRLSIIDRNILLTGIIGVHSSILSKSSQVSSRHAELSTAARRRNQAVLNYRRKRCDREKQHRTRSWSSKNEQEEGREHHNIDLSHFVSSHTRLGWQMDLLDLFDPSRLGATAQRGQNA